MKKGFWFTNIFLLIVCLILASGQEVVIIEPFLYVAVDMDQCVDTDITTTPGQLFEQEIQIPESSRVFISGRYLDESNQVDHRCHYLGESGVVSINGAIVARSLYENEAVCPEGSTQVAFFAGNYTLERTPSQDGVAACYSSGGFSGDKWWDLTELFSETYATIGDTSANFGYYASEASDEQGITVRVCPVIVIEAMDVDAGGIPTLGQAEPLQNNPEDPIYHPGVNGYEFADNTEDWFAGPFGYGTSYFTYDYDSSKGDVYVAFMHGVLFRGMDGGWYGRLKINNLMIIQMVGWDPSTNMPIQFFRDDPPDRIRSRAYWWKITPFLNIGINNMEYYHYTAGPGFKVLFKELPGLLPDGSPCTSDGECMSGNCDPDFDSATMYCHATATSCPDDSTEYVDGHELCLGDAWYRSCAVGTWGPHEYCDATDDWCDTGGGPQSGYDLAETCLSSTSGGCQATGCTSCEPYMAPSTSSCATSCATDPECWAAYHCDLSVCLPDLADGQVCDEHSDCTSGHCVSDYDGAGMWCAPPTSCAHDGIIFAEGESAPNCYDKETSITCISGEWEHVSCIPGTCSSGSCVGGGKKCEFDEDCSRNVPYCCDGGCQVYPCGAECTFHVQCSPGGEGFCCYGVCQEEPCGACGNGVCNWFGKSPETYSNCPQDCCSNVCDGLCPSASCVFFDPDCDAAGGATRACCGNDVCDIGENKQTCATDCTCLRYEVEEECIADNTCKYVEGSCLDVCTDEICCNEFDYGYTLCTADPNCSWDWLFLDCHYTCDWDDVCNPLCRPDPDPNCCGNGVCDVSETPAICARDCATCGLDGGCRRLDCSPNPDPDCCGYDVFPICDLNENIINCPDDCTTPQTLDNNDGAVLRHEFMFTIKDINAAKSAMKKPLPSGKPWANFVENYQIGSVGEMNEALQWYEAVYFSGHGTEDGACADFGAEISALCYSWDTNIENNYRARVVVLSACYAGKLLMPALVRNGVKCGIASTESIPMLISRCDSWAKYFWDAATGNKDFGLPPLTPSGARDYANTFWTRCELNVEDGDCTSPDSMIVSSESGSASIKRGNKGSMSTKYAKSPVDGGYIHHAGRRLKVISEDEKGFKYVDHHGDVVMLFNNLEVTQDIDKTLIITKENALEKARALCGDVYTLEYVSENPHDFDILMQRYIGKIAVLTDDCYVSLNRHTGGIRAFRKLPLSDVSRLEPCLTDDQLILRARLDKGNVGEIKWFYLPTEGIFSLAHSKKGMGPVAVTNEAGEMLDMEALHSILGNLSRVQRENG